MTVTPGGRQLTDLEFSATYACHRHHAVNLTESFLTPPEPAALESFGTFTVELAGQEAACSDERPETYQHPRPDAVGDRADRRENRIISKVTGSSASPA